MKIVINSHISSDIARAHFLESLQLYTEYKTYEYIIVIGGYYELSDYEITKEDNITYIKSNHNSIDFTGLIALLELYSEEIDQYYLYLHDTSKVGPEFFNKLQNINLENITSLSLTKFPSMNIGIYSQKIINTNKDFLLSRKNKDKNALHNFKKIGMNYEDRIFRNDPTTRILDNHRNRITTGPTDYYGTGTMRIVEYYSNLDLYKIKSCWGQGMFNLNN
jgi:hypothetical protein